MTAPLIYPTLPGLDINIIWRPQTKNFTPQMFASGRDAVVGAATYPTHQFDLIYNCLRNLPTLEEFKTFMGFFLELNGPLNGFCVTNAWDNQVTGQAIANGDGVTTDFLLVRTYGAGGFSGTEPVGYVNTGATFNAYINGGSPVSPTSYTLKQMPPTTGFPGNQLISFTSAPGSGLPITVDMAYYYYCRFLDDELEFSQLLTNVFELKKVTLQSKRNL